MKIIRRKADQGYLDRWLWVPKSYVSVDATKAALTHVLKNAYTEKERVLYLWKETENHLLLPRAFWDPAKLPFTVVDCRPQSFPEIDFEHDIKLDHRPQITDNHVELLPTGLDIQRRSAQALQAAEGGVLQLGCGRGKTVIALYHIATSRVPALVLVDNVNLLYQWLKEAKKLLKVPGGIGIYGDGKKKWQYGLVLATYHSVANWSETITEEQRRWFGQVFWDEGHHVSAPTFAATADMFYGRRYSLTATPSRDDGMHIVSDVHIGPVVYKDLTPTMVPTFAFMWTGLSPDLNDPWFASQILDANGEVHLSKVSSMFGKWKQRLDLVLTLVKAAEKHGRTTLVLSNSVDEVINLAALWEHGPSAELYSSILTPTPFDVGEVINPIALTNRRLNALKKTRQRLDKKRLDKKATPADILLYRTQIVQIDQQLKGYEVYKKIQNELSRRQRVYIRELTAATQRCGILTHDVPPATRGKMLEERKVIFAISKYGREGMDCPRLDTVIMSSLFSSRNVLQQLIGRPTRPIPGKRAPVILGLVDEVGQCRGMARKLAQHLRTWPVDEGGPYKPENIYAEQNQWKPSVLDRLFGP